MEKIFCNQCGKIICEADPKVHIGFQVENAGGIYKIPILFNGSADPLYFCTKPCQKKYYDLNVPKNEESSKLIAEMKAKIPEMTEQTVNEMKRVHQVLTKGRKQ